MGYNTEFSGEITSNICFDNETKKFIQGLSQTRRMMRDPHLLSKRLGISYEKCIGLYGSQCQHYFGDRGFAGQIETNDIINYNKPPASQPSLWCSWTVGDDNRSLVWNRSEKFYEYIDWMKYIVKELDSRGYNLNGEINWVGEESDDRGSIIVNNNRVESYFD